MRAAKKVTRGAKEATLGAAESLTREILIACGAAGAGAAAGFALGLPLALPLLTGVPGWLLMRRWLRAGSRGRAIGLLVWWAACLACACIVLTMTWPDRAAAAILNGPAYKEEMRAWLSTGVGRESTPSQFIPQHLLHAAIFCLLALATAGVAALVMGAMLLHYMSYYVGDLVAACQGRPEAGLAMLLAWNPWSIARVIAFIILGVVLSEPLLARLGGSAGLPDPAGRRRWAVVALGGLALDLILKSLLAPLWPGLIGACAGGAG